jgi:hypothetical protein
MSAVRSLTLALVAVVSISHAEGRLSQASARAMTPEASQVLAFNRNLALSSPRSLALNTAAPVATLTNFVDAHPDVSQAPPRSQDVWLMVLVCTLLVAHQLRRKQRSLNQRFMR